MEESLRGGFGALAKRALAAAHEQLPLAASAAAAALNSDAPASDFHPSAAGIPGKASRPERKSCLCERGEQLREKPHG